MSEPPEVCYGTSCTAPIVARVIWSRGMFGACSRHLAMARLLADVIGLVLDVSEARVP